MTTPELCALNAATKRARSIEALKMMIATTSDISVARDCKIALKILESL